MASKTFINAVSNKPRRRRRWLLRSAVVLVVLLGVGWFVLTSGPVVKALFLPRVASALQAKLSVSKLSLSPFSALDLKGVQISPHDGSPMVEVPEVKIRYQLMGFLTGKVAIDELELIQPSVRIHQRPDGGTDLQDWLAKLGGDEAGSGGGSRSVETLNLQIGKLVIRGGSLAYAMSHADGAKDVLSIGGLDFAVDQVRNGRTSAATMSATLQYLSIDASGRIINSLATTGELTGRVELGDALELTDFDTSLKLAVTGADGSVSRSVGLGAALNARGSLTRLENLALQFLRDGAEVGRVEIRGGYDLAAGNGRFEIDVPSLPPDVLELATLKSGLDFELADFSATNRINISAGGNSVDADGAWVVKGVTATSAAGTTPVLDLALDFDTGIDLPGSRAMIKNLALVTRQNGQALIDLRVVRPFHFNWSGRPASETGSTLALDVRQLRLSDWRALTGELPLDGLLAVSAGIQAAELGRQLAFTAEATLEQGRLAVGTNLVEGLGAVMSLKGGLDSFDELAFPELTASLRQSDESLLELAGAGRVGLGRRTAALQTTLRGDLVALAAAVADPRAKISSGSLTITNRAEYSSVGVSLQGTLAVADLDVEFEGARFDNVGIVLPFEATHLAQTLTWKLADGAVTTGGLPAVRLESTGHFDSRDQSAVIDLALPLINERLINPLLAPHESRQQLRSAQAAIDLKGRRAASGHQRWSLAAHSTNIVLVTSNDVPVGPSLGSRARIEFEVDQSGGEVALQRWQGNLFADGQPAGELTAAGRWRLDGSLARFDAKLAGVNEHALGPLSTFLIGDRRIEKAKLSAESTVEYDATKPSQVRLGIKLEDVRVFDPAGRFPESPRDVGMNFRADIAGRRVDLAEGLFQVTPSGGLSNRIDLAGWVDLSKPAAIRGDLSLSSPGFDLSPIYSLLERRPAATNEAPDTTVARERVQAAGILDVSQSRPVERFDLAVDVRQLKLRELLVTNWQARATVFSNSVDLGLLSLQLNGAPINARFHSTNIAGASRYELAAEIERLRLAPLVHTFYPDWTGLAEADVYWAVNVNGNARPGQSLWSAAAGNLFLGITNANFQPFNRRVQSALRPVGLLLQSPELFSSPINWASYHVQLTNQTLLLERATVISDAYVLDTGFAVPLTDDFTSSPLPRTALGLYLSRNLVTQLGFLKGFTTNQTSRYVQIPDFMFLNGTLGVPQVETDKLRLAGMTLGKAGDYVGGSAGDLLQKAGGVSKTLGGIVSGRAVTGADKAEANVVSKGIEGVFDAVGGFLGGTGRAVEKGAGAVTGTKVVESDVLEQRLAAFDWPRVFTNAPNRLTADP